MESFRVRTTGAPDAVAIARAVEAALNAPLSSPPIPEAEIAFDNSRSPWHTVCEVRPPDKPGLLHALASALAAAGVSVHSARVANEDDMAVDRFEVTDQDGHKLDGNACDEIVAFVHGGSVTNGRLLLGRRPRKVRVADPSLAASPQSD